MNRSIQRHKAAIRRIELSLPTKCLVRDQILENCDAVFDYGCGHGDDVQGLQSLGVTCTGWDPAHAPDTPKLSTDAVNLGFVLNVIEDPQERAETLRAAWTLTKKVLCVAARIMVGGRGDNEIEFNDGVVTKIGTFQKYFTQAELREYLETVLETQADPAAPGVFYIFRDESLRQQFLASRYRRRSAAPRKRISEQRFEQHREILEPLIEWVTARGRLPQDDELIDPAPILTEFGSIRRAFALIRRVTNEEEWEDIKLARAEDLLVYLALSHFPKRPRFSQLPIGIQRDVRSFFGTYKKACEDADELLFCAGDPDIVNEACRRSPVGKLMPNALYIHKSAMSSLDPILRVYEGCARAYLGEIEDTNLVKLHRFSGKVSYLAYPSFEKNPHPQLMRSVKLSLRTLDLNCYDYSDTKNPPILHRKETFLCADDPLYKKFSKLTRQEERHGLLDETATIGNRNGWNIRLDEAGFTLRGHRLVRKK